MWTVVRARLLVAVSACGLDSSLTTCTLRVCPCRTRQAARRLRRCCRQQWRLTMSPPGDPEDGGDEKRCSHCGSSHTSQRWRRHPTSGQLLCGACGQYAVSQGGQLPPDSVLQRRPVQPRHMADVRRGMAQRRCLQCGSASPGGGKRPCWYRHPATGEKWLCGPCCKRIYDRLKGRKSHPRTAQQAAGVHDVEEEQQQEQQAVKQSAHNTRRQQLEGGGKRSSEEGEEAPAAQVRQRAKRERQQQQQRVEQEAAPTFNGPASAFEKRERSSAVSGAALEQQAAPLPGHPSVAPAGGSGQDQLPVAQRRQRRKQAHPQHLPQEARSQPEEQLQHLLQQSRPAD